ncbi:MAG: CtsR family transcriptional regulator [Christensenellaceae bacterium]
MSILSDHIESFIKDLFVNDEGTAELQRNELAQQFNCAPSQINYVLTTRFSTNRGYVIESKRGGGGYIKVIRLDVQKSDYISDIIEQQLSGGINMRQASELIEGFVQIGFIKQDIKNVILSAISDKALCVPESFRNELRSAILKEVLFSMIVE